MTQLISVGIGQCGTQVASSFTDFYMKEASHYIDSDAQSRFFYEDKENRYVARCVLIDTESKVVNDILQNKTGMSNWKYDPSSIWAQGGGAGNNWAVGYKEEDFQEKNEVMNRLRYQVEKCDSFGGFLTFQSLAGGTGSGLGSKLTEEIRDLFGKAQVLTNVVWPHKTGEVCSQHINSVLSLSCLLKNSNAIISSYNDVLKEICEDLKGEGNVTFQDMNMLIAQSLASVFLPSKNGCKIQLLSGFLAHSAPLPQRKMLSLFSLPIVSDTANAFTTYNWTSLCEDIVSMAGTYNFTGKNITSTRRLLQNKGLLKKSDNIWLILRGTELTDGRDKITKNEVLNSPDFFPPDNYDPVLVSTSTRQFNNKEKSITAVANSAGVCDPLDDLLSRFNDLISAGAFTYQYYEEGIEPDRLKRDFWYLEKVLNDYQNL